MNDKNWMKGHLVVEPRQSTDDKSRANFDAMLASYGGSILYEEIGGQNLRNWAELSPDGKLAYIVRDAVLSGVSLERFVQAAREIVGGDAADRERIYLGLLLDSQKELTGLEKMLAGWTPESNHDLFAPSQPLTEKFKAFIGELMAELFPGAVEQPASRQERDTGRERG
jgi:hypothetical protein